MNQALAGPEYAVAIVVYLLVMVIVGSVVGKKVKEDKDGFLLAGRQLPLIVLVGTLLATWFGGGTVIGSASFIYKSGPWAGILFFSGAPLGALALIKFAPKIRSMAKYTVPEILEQHYGRKTSLIASICILLAYTGIVSYSFTGAAYIVNIITGFDQTYSTIIAAVIMVLLAVTSGMNSVAWTDFLSTVMIFIGMGFGLFFVLGASDGYSSAYEALTPAQASITGGMSLIQMIGYILPVFLLYLGDQNQLQRYACAKSEAEAKKSAKMLFVAMSTVMFLVISFCLCAIKLMPGINGETVILRMAVNYMPFICGAPLLCACVAFIVTTGDSFILSAATNIMIDIVQKYFKPDMTDKQLIKGTRTAIVGVGIFSYIMAVYLPEVLAMQMYSYSMYGAAVTIPLFGVFFYRKISQAGGMASVLTGGAAILIWDIILKRPMGLNGIIIAAPLAIIALVLFSNIFPREENASAR